MENYNTIELQYSFSSALGPLEEGRFIKEHTLQINWLDKNGEYIENIGSIKFLMVYVDEIFNSHFLLFEILEGHSEYLARHIFKVIDLDSDNYQLNIQKHFDFSILSPNICFITDVRISPAFRGNQIAAKAIKDLVFHYSSGCGIFIIQPYPLQFESKEKSLSNNQLELEKLENNERKATSQLCNYYKSIGFEKVNGIKDLLFYNPAKKNEKFDQINIEDGSLIKRA